MFNKNYKIDDAEFKMIVDYTNLLTKSGSGAESLLPWLKYFPNKALKQVQKGIAIRDPFLRKNSMNIEILMTKII